MDKSWIGLHQLDERYRKGIESFIEFVRQHMKEDKHLCPCKVCRLGNYKMITLREMFQHLLTKGMMQGYTTWHSHGELAEARSLYQLRRQHVLNMSRQSSVNAGSRGHHANPSVLNILQDAFTFRGNYESSVDDATDQNVEIDPIGKAEYDKYRKLLSDAQTPLFSGSDKTVLEFILNIMQVKVKNRWSDKSFDDLAPVLLKFFPKGNQFPDSYREVKRIMKNLGLDYETIHVCEYGCVLYYKDLKDLEFCPKCNEPRYVVNQGNSKIPRKVIRYFPLTPRLRRLYMSPHISKEMRWHGERVVTPGYFRHPADGEAWQNFNREFPDFASEIRNVRFGLATDGFNPFGNNNAYSVWPIVLVPYNLPPSLCMKKEFNLLTMLIAGRKSPAKCLNVFMRPLIDELKVLWNEGIVAFDRQTDSTFTLKAAVLWTISDFPGLGMLGGKKTKGYKACPECLDETDATILFRRCAYQGHRRWLPKDHRWRKEANKFNGKEELRDPPPSLSGSEILAKINLHEYPVLSLHPMLQTDETTGLCWTHKSILYELPYWKTLRQPFSLDVMHIEKNVFDNIIGTILNIEGKTRDDINARQGLKKLKIRKRLWPVDSSGSSANKPILPPAPYTVAPEQKMDILEMIQNVKYPHGYAGSLKSKINLKDKKFNGLKTHDCHVMLQRLLPIFIRPYLPKNVVDPLIWLSRFFQKLCCKELKREDILQMKADIVNILCQLERIFPPAFFTIMVHLMIHLPDQLLLKGPVHYSWMYPIERQLGEYKNYVRNTRYPEGCIAEQYISRECATFCKLYMEVDSYNNTSLDIPSNFSLSVASDLIIPDINLPTRLSKNEIDDAHWCVLVNCTEAQYFIDHHKRKVDKEYPNISVDACIKNFLTYFRTWINCLKIQNYRPKEKSGHEVSSQDIVHELHKLANEPQAHNCYSTCYVNGVKFVTWERDQKLMTQNSGVMVEAGNIKYYGVLENVIELIYADGLKVIVFKCRWFDTDPEKRESTKNDRGLLLIDTSTRWYEDAPYCLAATAKQVFYIDEPNQEGEKNWKVVNEVAHRGTYSADSIARNENYEVDDGDAPYQEAAPENIPDYIPPEDGTLGKV